MKKANLAELELIYNAWENESLTNTSPYGKYITKEKDYYYLNRTIQNLRFYYGIFKDLDKAKKYREQLIEYGWDEEKVGLTTNHIFETEYGYNIFKIINNYPEYFGTFNTEEEALEAEKAATDNLSEIVDSTKEQARALLRSHNASIFDIKEKHNIMNSTKEDNIEEVEEVPQVSNLDAVIIKLSDIVDKLDPGMDRMVLAFPDDQGSYFYNGDEEFITVGTINGYKIDHITMVDSDAFNNNTISVDIGEEDLDYAYEGLMKEADKDIKDGEGLEEEK